MAVANESFVRRHRSEFNESMASMSPRPASYASTRKKRRRPTGTGSPQRALNDVIEGATRAMGSLPPAVLGAALYGCTIVFLFVYWWISSSRLGEVNRELQAVSGTAKVRGMEHVELSKLLLRRIFDDYSFLLEEAARAMALTNVTVSASAGHVAYNELLPQLYGGLEMASNVSSQMRPEAHHDLLLSLSRSNPGGIGSPQWGFKRDAQIRTQAGAPLRLASAVDVPPAGLQGAQGVPSGLGAGGVGGADSAEPAASPQAEEAPASVAASSFLAVNTRLVLIGFLMVVLVFRSLF